MRGILWIVVASFVLACRSVGAWAQEGSPNGGKLEPTDFTMLPLGTDSGEDDDPALVRARDGSYHLAWLSNRTGNAEIFAAGSTDGLSWGKPVRVTNHDFQDWYPSLLQGPDGVFHLVWMRVTPPPDNFQHLWYNRSVDGLTAPSHDPPPKNPPIFRKYSPNPSFGWARRMSERRWVRGFGGGLGAVDAMTSR
jgi:hypothetical protein